MNKVDYINKHIDNFFENNTNSLYLAQESYADMLSLNKGTIFYKYYPLNDPYTIKNIADNVLHFSNPTKFNDPFDSVMGISIDSIIKSYIKGLIMPYIETNEIVDNQIKRLALNLFDSTTNDNLLDLIDENGIVNDLQVGKTIPNDKALLILNEINKKDPELMNKIKNKKITETELMDFLDLGHSNFIRKIVDAQISNKTNIKLFSSNNIIDELEKICCQNKIDFDWNKLKREIEDKKKELYKILKETLSDILRITCFSEEYDNILMWSHYANKHDGICVAYNFKKSIELQTLALPIRYDNKRPSISENELKYNKQEPIINRTSLTKLLIDSLLIKSDSWKYENEWRVILPKEKLNDDNLFSDSIVSIYFGVKVSDEIIKDTIKVIKESNHSPIKFYKMKMHDSSFSLVSEEILDIA